MTPKCPDCKHDQDDCSCSEIIESLRQQLEFDHAEYKRLRDDMRQQLADTKLVLGQAMATVDELQKSNVMLRSALRHLWNERTPDSLDEAGEALAATADLDGLILCHATPDATGTSTMTLSA